MKLIEDTVASVIFDLKVGSYEGDIIESVTEFEPFEFVFGKGKMLQSFEDKLKGLTLNEDFKFMLPKEEAYGEYMPEMQVEFEKQFIVDQFDDTVDINDELILDNYLPMQDSEGNSMNGKITLIDDKIIKLDFNHPLADMDLYFTGKVLSLRPANAQEIEDGEIFNHSKFEAAGPDDPPVCNY